MTSSASTPDPLLIANLAHHARRGCRLALSGDDAGAAVEVVLIWHLLRCGGLAPVEDVLGSDLGEPDPSTTSPERTDVEVRARRLARQLQAHLESEGLHADAKVYGAIAEDL